MGNSRSGRRPLPTAIKEATGAFIKDPQRRPKNEPEPPIGYPMRPKYMSGIAAETWDQITEMLDQMRVLTQADYWLVEMFCDTYATWREAAEKCRKLGVACVVDDNGKVKVLRHAFNTAREKAVTQCKELLIEMGLTPAARSKVQATSPAPEKDPLIRMFDGAG